MPRRADRRDRSASSSTGNPSSQRVARFHRSRELLTRPRTVAVPSPSRRRLPLSPTPRASRPTTDMIRPTPPDSVTPSAVMSDREPTSPRAPGSTAHNSRRTVTGRGGPPSSARPVASATMVMLRRQRGKVHGWSSRGVGQAARRHTVSSQQGPILSRKAHPHHTSRETSAMPSPNAGVRLEGM